MLVQWNLSLLLLRDQLSLSINGPQEKVATCLTKPKWHFCNSRSDWQNSTVNLPSWMNPPVAFPEKRTTTIRASVHFIVFVMSKRHPCLSLCLSGWTLSLFCCCRIRFDQSHSETTELMKLHASQEKILKMNCLKSFSNLSFDTSKVRCD